jgi:serine/threonine-protein kinase ULK2
MEYCSGGDLTNYIKKRGRVENLEYIPEPGAAPQYFPHPRTGGLAEIVVRSFLRQLGARALSLMGSQLMMICIPSTCTQVLAATKLDSP